MTKKGWGITAIIGVAVFLFIIFTYSLVYDRLELVSLGLASPKFPYTKYSQQDLNTMYPQYINENVETTRTPEETHALLLSHLKANEIDEAVECCFMRGDWETQKEFFQGVKDKGMWDIMIGDLDTIEKELDLGTKASYSYSGSYKGEKIKNTMSFVKNSDGIWLIENL